MVVAELVNQYSVWPSPRLCHRSHFVGQAGCMGRGVCGSSTATLFIFSFASLVMRVHDFRCVVLMHVHRVSTPVIVFVEVI